MSKCQLVVVVSYRTCDHKILGPNSRVVLVSHCNLLESEIDQRL